ncbi:MAG: Rieske 2Fe-2S domain-containing protein [Amnibacterium sp.]
MKELRILKPIAKLEDAAFLDPVVNVAKRIVDTVVRPQALRDVLHGVPLGHPLHPLLILLPAGAWTSAAVLDLVPGSERAARTLVGAGLIAAVPTALSGETDWSALHPQQMRVGIVHAALNSTAIALYTASWFARRRGDHLRGKALGLAGFGAIGLGGYLGGHLSYRQAAGANHTESVPHRFPSGWQELGPLEDLPDGELARKLVKGQPLLVHRTGSSVQVLSNTCSHLSGPLHQGELSTVPGEGACVTCPWHRSTFSLETGEVVHGPATSPQPRFEARVTAGTVEVRLPEHS